MKNKKKVAIITNIPAPYRVAFFQYLQENETEYEFFIIYSSRNEDNRKWKTNINPNSFFLKSKTIKIVKKDYSKYIHVPVNAGKVLNQIQPDMIVASEYSPTILQTLLWAKMHRRKFISWTDGTLHSERNINPVQKISRRLIIGAADAYIASSSKSKEAQLSYGADEKKISISYLTVDIDRFLCKKTSYEEKNILYVGQLVHGKGIDILLKALPKLKEQNYHLYLVGDGKDRKAYEDMVKSLGIQGKVSFEGFQDQEKLKEYYQKARYFVFPSRDDCFGLVMLEAMCNGLPVLASNYADGAYDLIEDGTTGYIFPLEDEKEFLLKMDKLLEDEDLLKKMGDASYEKAKSFHFKYTAKGFINAVRECEKK